MYISNNSNIGMATLLQQNKNCMKTLANGRGGNIIVGNKVISGTPGGGLVQVGTQQAVTSSTLTPVTSVAGFSNSFVLPTQTIVFTNGGQPGANSILSYPQLVQQQQPQQQRVLMQQEMVSLPIGSIVQTSGGTYALVQGPRQDNKGMAQGSFLVAATAGTTAGTTNIITSSASSFQQQFQQQLATTSNNGNTTTTTRYFSQFSQQPATSSISAAPTVIPASSNRTQVLINRANNTIIAGNTTQRLQHTAILKKTPPKVVTIASATVGSQQPQQIVRMQSITAQQVQIQPQRPQIQQVRPQLPSVRPQLQQRPQVVVQRAPVVLQRPQVILQRPQAQQSQQQQAQQQSQQPQQQQSNQFQKAQAQQLSQQQHSQQQPSQQQNQSRYGASTLQKIRQQQFQQEQVSSGASAHTATTITTTTPPTVMNGAPAATPAATYPVPNGKADAAASDASTTNGALLTSNSAADEELEPEVDIVINNVVCSFSVRCHLNLRDIALNGANVEYRRENGMVTMKLRRPYTTASIWSSGRITCTGATSETQSKIAARRYARTLEKLGFHVRFQNFRIVNVLGTCSMPWAIRITSFSEKYKKDASYEPELHPGVTYKLRTPKATLKIFSTGSITVTAASVANVQAAIEHVYPLVHEFRKKRSPQEEEHMRQKQLLRAEMIEIEMNRSSPDSPSESPGNILKRKRTFAADNSVQKRRRSGSDGEGSDIHALDDADDEEVIYGDYEDIDQLIEGPDDE